MKIFCYRCTFHQAAPQLHYVSYGGNLLLILLFSYTPIYEYQIKQLLKLLKKINVQLSYDYKKKYIKLMSLSAVLYRCGKWATPRLFSVTKKNFDFLEYHKASYKNCRGFVLHMLLMRGESFIQ